MRRRRILSVEILLACLSLMGTHCAVDQATPQDMEAENGLDPDLAPGGISFEQKSIRTWSSFYYVDEGNIVREGPLQGWQIVGQDIGNGGDGDRVYTWLDSGVLLIGTSTQLDRYTVTKYVPALGGGISMVRGIGIAKNTQRVYYYFSDSTFSIGDSRNWDRYSGRRSYAPASGFSANQLVDVAIAGNTGRVYYYWLDQSGRLWRTIGDSLDADRYSGKTSVSKMDNSIAGIAFNFEDTSYTWYATDHIVRTGSSTAL